MPKKKTGAPGKRRQTQGKNPGERTGASTKRTAVKPYATAHAAGVAAGRTGQSISACPYSPSSQEDLARLWIAGHRQGRDDRRTTGTPLPAERSTGTRRAS